MQVRSVRWVGVAAVGLTICAGMAGADSAPPTASLAVPSFEKLDRNADKRLSRSEAGFDRVFSDQFVACDVDGDGYVVRTEFVACGTPVEPVRL